MADQAEQLFKVLLDKAYQRYLATPSLRQFSGWPADLIYQPQQAKSVQACIAIKNWPTDDPLHLATKDVCDIARWKQSYSLDEVGQAFLDAYGYIELVGPDGVYRSDQLRVFIGYWGPDIHYPWHRHEAVEIYQVISGAMRFETQDGNQIDIEEGDTHSHKSWQAHQMFIGPKGVLALALWKGAGLANLPRLDEA